jgi:Glycosyltransferase family 87
MKSKIWTFVILIIAIAYCLIEAEGQGDFYIFMSVSAFLDGHTDIYAHQFNTYYNYFYSVLFALFLKPFYTLPFFLAKFSWLMLNLFLYYHLFLLLSRSQFLSVLVQKQRILFLTLVFLFSFRFLHENIHSSQITILILWCCIYSIYCIRQGKIIRGSLILALGINIKLLPIVLLPYLIYRGNFKAFTITLIAYFLSLLAPGIIIGNRYNLDLLHCWFNLINPTNVRHVFDVDERSFHSLTTLLSTLFVENVSDYHSLNLKRNIANVSIQSLSKFILFVRLGLVTFTLYFLKLRLFKPATSVKASVCELSYILLLVPLIFPHQQHYAFLFITPAFALILYSLLVNQHLLPIFQKRIIGFLLLLIYFACNLKILVGEYNHYYEHFKILTYGTILLIPLLIWTTRVTWPLTNSETAI